MFSLPVSGQIIIWIIVGGLGTLIGPVIGCIVMQFLTNELGTLSQVSFGWVDPNLVLGHPAGHLRAAGAKGLTPWWPTPGGGSPASPRRAAAAPTPAADGKSNP